MPKQKATTKKKNASPPPRPFWRKKLSWALLTVVLIILGSVIVPAVSKQRKEDAVASDRARFAQADKDVKTISDAILAQIGPPSKKEENKYCSIRSAKWEDVKPSCKTGVRLVYSNIDANTANDWYETMTESIKEKFVLKKVSKSNNLLDNSFQSINVAGEFKLYQVYLLGKSSMECRATYTFLFPVTIENFEIDLHCGGTAHTSVYPLLN